MDIIVSGSQKERVVVIPTSQGKREYHFYASCEDFKRMLVNAGASYQYLASIRALFYCNFNVESVEIVYGIWDLKPVQWLDWDERVVVNFDIEGVFIVQYVIKPLDYNAWKVIRKLLIELDKQGIQKFPSDLENL